MENILFSIIIPTIVIFIMFFFLNYILKKKIENYGIYCGMYNVTTVSNPKSSCNNDTECSWNNDLGYCTNNNSLAATTPTLLSSLELDLTSLEETVTNVSKDAVNAVT
jgi:hypothetical protein